MALFILSILVVTVCNAFRNDYTIEASSDQITSLPGLDSATLSKYNMFSGYIDVYPQHNRSIHYWFVESLNDSKNDPVAIWTNGGPGASGMIGFFTEQGPFRPLKNLSLMINPYSWINIMSMIFIESPAGVGFSFSNDTSDYNIGDNKTAIDNYHFIQGWLNKYPNYLQNDFYITSESYGGHYMPTLAKQIIDGNKAGNKPIINFKGVFVGNPSTDPYEHERGIYDTLYGHQMVSRPVYQQWYIKCKNGNISYHDNTDCKNAHDAMNNDVGSNINRYALDYPVCQNGESKDNQIYLFYKYQYQNGRYIPPFYQRMIKFFEQFPNEQFYIDPQRKYQQNLLKNTKKTFPDFEDSIPYEPCSENYMTSYLNQVSVQDAIHVIHKKWPGTDIHYSNNGTNEYMEPFWQYVIDNMDENNKLKLTIVSGDDDTVCAPLGTQSWIWEMGWNVDKDNNWKVWTDSDGQTGGYFTRFIDGVNFLTVHSAGHMIPGCRPSRSLQTLTRYLKGEF